MAEVIDDLQGSGRRVNPKKEAEALLSGRAGKPIGFGRTAGDRIATNTIIEGSIMRSQWRELGRSTQNKFITQMRIGLRNGESTERMAARISGGVIRGDRVHGIMDTTRKQARTLVRTSTNAVQNRSRLVAMQSSDMVIAIQQVSTLDNRTSDICIAFSGQVWDANTLEPIAPSTLPFNGGPPRHFNCRSTLNPVLKSFEELGFEVGELPPATRASIDGEIPAEITMTDFLWSRSVSRQNKMLGKGRAQLFRDRKITLTQLVDMRGNPLTLEQLEGKVGLGPLAPKPKPAGPPDKNRDLLTFKEAPEVANKANMRAFKDAPNDLKETINAQPPLKSVTINQASMGQRGAFYRTQDRRINMWDPDTAGPKTRSWDSVWAHEYGHHLDHETGIGNIPFSGQPAMRSAKSAASRRLKTKSQSRGSGILSQAYQDKLADNFQLTRTQVEKKIRALGLNPDKLRTMWKKHWDIDTDELANAMNRQLLSAIEAEDAGYILHELLRPTEGISPKGLGVWSHMADFFGAMTKNRIGWGHKKSYYKGRFGFVQQGTEMYAQFVATAAEFEQLNIVLRIFAPEFTEQILDSWKRRGL